MWGIFREYESTLTEGLSFAPFCEGGAEME